MSSRHHTRSCPSCERELSGREHFGEGGLTVIWNCICGWGSARTVSAHEQYAEGALPTSVDIRSSKSSGVRARPRPVDGQGQDGENDPAEGQRASSSGIKTRTNDG